jgi:hypothetical protein
MDFPQGDCLPHRAFLLQRRALGVIPWSGAIPGPVQSAGDFVSAGADLGQIEGGAGFMTKLQLPNVTIWAAWWSEDAENFRRTVRALRYCQSIIDCPRWVLFISESLSTRLWILPETPPDIEAIKIPVLDWQRWSIFVNREAPKHLLDTEFALCIHEDGFPIDLSLWTDEFFDYDYIGAPWAAGNEWGPKTVGLVGNGGFFMQSNRFMRKCLEMPPNEWEHKTPSDVLVCVRMRNWFLSQGMRFASFELGARFSTEQTHKQTRSFGFHGRRDSPDKYRFGWGLIEAFERNGQ